MGELIKVKVVNRTTLELSQDAKSGDYIDLEKIESVDSSFINEIINKEKDTKIKDQIEDALKAQKETLDKDKTIEIQDAKAKLKEQFIKEIESLKQELAQKDSSNKLEITKITTAKEKTIQELESQIKNFKDNKDKDLLLQKQQIEKENSENISNLKADFEKEKKRLNDEFNKKIQELQTLNTKLNTKLEGFEDTSKAKLSEELTKKEIEVTKNLTSTFEKEKKELEDKISVLTREKANLNVKQTGEDLETWCDREVLSYMQNGFKNCEWHKDNLVVKDEGENKGSKADFIFNVYASEDKKPEELLTSVCLDMKDENPESVNKKANSYYFPQLDKNRKKKGCKFAVLVSNLELDKPNDIPIYRVYDYEDMYVVRPAYLMTFLNMIASLNTTFAKLTLQKEAEQEKFKSFKEFEDEFEKLKNTYLDKPLDQLSSIIESIATQNEKIEVASKSIQDNIDKIKSSYLKSIQEKLNKFSIKVEKNYKKID